MQINAKAGPAQLMKSLIAGFLALGLCLPAAAEEDNIPSNFTIADDLTEYAGLGSMPGAGFGDEGAFRFGCLASHFDYHDPIVFPGQPGASHLHMFFGNTLTDHNSTYQTLRQTGNGTCDGNRINRTGYWAPAMISGRVGKIVKPQAFLIYYKSRSPYTADSRNLPRGLKMIAGKTADNLTSDGFVGWACESGNGAPDTSEHTTIGAISGCPSSNRIRIWLDFPNCWDGTNLDSADHRSHMAYRGSGDAPNGDSCPSTHPTGIPNITVIIFFNHEGPSDYASWHLSADRHNGASFAGGTTFHSDWFGAWDQTVSDHWTKECDGITVVSAGTRRECDVGVLGQYEGDGNVQQLTNNPNYANPLIEANRYEDIPVNAYRKRGKGRGRMR